jgi:2,4-diketo-3-deoxy-L-fuconate hydrolase
VVIPDATFAFGTFAGGDSMPFPGLVVGGQVHDLRPAFGQSTTTLELLRDWDASLLRLRQLAATSTPDGGTPLGDLRPLPPVSPAAQVLCAGANYFQHLREIAFSMGRVRGETRSESERRAAADEEARSRAKDDPFVFALVPSALSGAVDDVILWGPGTKHDWELELAVVIGRGGREIPEADALAHVAGYTICNDVSTRDVMFRPNFPMTDFLMTKGRPGFLPLGPYIVPREFVPDYRTLRITLRVNGAVMQDETANDMIHGVERLVSYTSTVVTLGPGDILLTGSPAGNAGHHDDRWLVPGDVMEGEITGLGLQRNLCVAPGDRSLVGS